MKKAESMTFNYHMYGNTMGSMAIQYSDHQPPANQADNSGWTTCHTYRGQQQTSHYSAWKTFDSRNYCPVNGRKFWRIRYTDGGSWQGDAAIDVLTLRNPDLALQTRPPTQAPTRDPCAVDIRVDLNTRIWANEIRWAIDGHSEVGSLGHHGKSSPYQNYRTYRWVGEIQPGTHKLNMFDTYGDGWHGATIWVKNHNSGAQYLKHSWSGWGSSQAKYFNVPASC
jgi:hypothetical protein